MQISEGFFCDPLKSIIQTTKVQQHAYHPQIQFAEINYFCYGRTIDYSELRIGGPLYYSNFGEKLTGFPRRGLLFSKS